MPYTPPRYDPVIPDTSKHASAEKTPILIIGAGPIGLTTALDLGQRGHKVIVVTKATQLTDGSRAICFAKRPLEILDRLGVGEKMVEKGVGWNIGHVFYRHHKEPAYSFDLLPIKNQKMPAMINLQQYYNEEYMISALKALPNVELRWGNSLIDLKNTDSGAIATLSTKAGPYKIEAEWVIACDGSRSETRKMLNIDFHGETFKDNFLIADVKFKKDYPTERHFWFDPEFNRDQSVLLHKQPDDVWRVDFQVGWDIDREAIVDPAHVRTRIEAMFGTDVEFEFEWISVYTFNCRRVETMVSKRVIFAGDSAHLVSPFGARGANTGFQDADNIGWKLDLFLRGLADRRLIESYNEERLLAADVNIMNSTRSTDFITPKTPISRHYRDAVLELSRDLPGVRGFVNSGRLSTPVPYPRSSLNTSDDEDWSGGVAPGYDCIDAPLIKGGEKCWLLNQLGWHFTLVIFSNDQQWLKQIRPDLKRLENKSITVKSIIISQSDLIETDFLLDQEGLAMKRYHAKEGSVYLIRPDQYVAARWHEFNPEKIKQAVRTATAQTKKSI